MSLLQGLGFVQIGTGLAASVCGRLFADAGADVCCDDPEMSTRLAAYLNHGKPVVANGAAARRSAIATAKLIVCEGRPQQLRALQYDADSLRRLNATAALVYISPFGQTGPKANDPGADLTRFFASGIARLLTGQVDALAEPPIRPVGEQSAFIGGLAAACAGMHAALAAPGVVVDVSIAEALATMAITELARAGLGGKTRPRKREADGNGATVTILPASDGYVAISPREERQWTAWLSVTGSPDWACDPRFATKPDRVANWDALHALMSAWSRQYSKQLIADRAQAAHVPSFPLREPAEQLESPQLAHRKFWRRGRAQRTNGQGSGTSLRAAGHHGQQQFGRSQSGADAPLGHSRPGLQLGYRRPDGDALSRGDGRRNHQGRGAWTRRPRTRLGTAHGSRPGETKHRPRPEEPGRGRCRAGARRALRRRRRKFRYWRHGKIGTRRHRSAGAQSGSALCLGLRSRANRAGGARRGLRHPLAVLRRFRRAQSPSRYSATGRIRLARPDVRADARFHRRRRAVAPAPGRRCRPDRFFDDRGDAVDHGRTLAGRP